jgi:hypothetical protein
MSGVWSPEAVAWADSVGMDVETASESQRMMLNHRAGFALPLKAFIAQRVAGAAPLIGTPDDNVLPSGGLMLTGGLAGAGKTTLAIDGAFHLASGVDWLGLKVPEALRVLILENEGPREPFRRKLERKHETWRHAMLGEIYVNVFNWGSLTLKDSDTRQRLGQYLEAMSIDLVIADPLGGLGMDGVGSPADTRAFVDLLKLVGLGSTTAWWLLHHFRKEPTAEEVDAFRGAWGDHADALLALKNADGDRLRLSFPKLRWADPREPFILSRDRDTAGFCVVAEGEHERDYAAEILALLADGDWRTASEIKAPVKDGGIGAKRETVNDTLGLLAKAGRVEYAKGPAGKAPTAHCWRLHDGSCKPVQEAFPGNGSATCTAPLLPRRGRGPGASAEPRLHEDGAS